jgi:hypothetical protein
MVFLLYEKILFYRNKSEKTQYNIGGDPPV